MSFVAHWCPPGERDILFGRTEEFQFRPTYDCCWMSSNDDSGPHYTKLPPPYQVAITHSQHVLGIFFYLFQRDGDDANVEGCAKEHVSNIHHRAEIRDNHHHTHGTTFGHICWHFLLVTGLGHSQWVSPEVIASVSFRHSHRRMVAMGWVGYSL